MSLLLLAAILAAMNPTFLRLHVHVYPAPPSDSRDAQLHTFDLTLPPAPPRSGRLIATDGSSRHTPSQGISPAPRGTGGLSNCCEADRGGVMPRTDVEGGECATHEAVANSSYVEQTVRVEKRALEASGSAKKTQFLNYTETPAMPRTCSGQMSLYSRVRLSQNAMTWFARRDRKFLVVVFTLA